MALQIKDITNFMGFTNTKARDAKLPEKPAFDVEKEGDRQTLFGWKTVTRPVVSPLSSQRISRPVLIIGGFIAFLLVLMQEFFLIAVIGSAVFLYFALSSAPSEEVSHELTNHGVMYSGQFYGWGELKQYFFLKTASMDTLCIDTIERLPGRLFFMLNPGDLETVKEIVGRYLPFLEEEPKTFVDKMYDSAAKRITLDKN